MIEDIHIPHIEYVNALKGRLSKRYVKNHTDALAYVIEHHKELPKISSICELHKKLMITFPEILPGRLRTGFVSVGGELCPSPNKVPYLLDDWCYQLKSGCNEMEEHKKYEMIHPFQDGNGRSGRLLWLWLLLHNGKKLEETFLETNYAHDMFKMNRLAYYAELKEYRAMWQMGHSHEVSKR